MDAIATVGVPAWGSAATPVLRIEGETWTVLGPKTKLYPHGRRKLHVNALNLRQLCPTRVGLLAKKDGEVKHSPPIGNVQGEDWRRARSRRRGQLQWCARNGWTVRAAEVAAREAA